jgi:hypothetical protein
MVLILLDSNRSGIKPGALHSAAPGLWARINPLAMGPLSHGWENLSAEEARRRTETMSRITDQW